MSSRAYMLLDIVDGKSEQVARVLRDTPGVVISDCLDGRPNVLVLVEASDRLKLAKLLMPVLTAIDNVTEDLRLLVSRDSTIPTALFSA